MSQIIDENGCFLLYAQVAENSGNEISFLQYYSICDGFNPIWKSILRIDGQMGSPSRNLGSEIMDSGHVARFAYDELIFHPYMVESRKLKREDTLGVD